MVFTQLRLSVGRGEQSCAPRRQCMKFPDEIGIQTLLSDTPCNGVALRKPSPGSVSQAKSLLFGVFYFFSKSLHIFCLFVCLLLFQAHSHLYHYISHSPTRKQKHTDHLKQRIFNAGNWLHLMEEAEILTREQKSPQRIGTSEGCELRWVG